VNVVSEVLNGTAAQVFDKTQLFQTGFQSQATLDEARPYTLAELQAAQTVSLETDYRQFVRSYGLNAVLQMRVRESSGVDGWLTILKSGSDFTERDKATMKACAPILRGALQAYVAMERERFAASLTAEAVRRLQFGWVVLDGYGTVLECDSQGELMLTGSGIIGRHPNGRLTAWSGEIDKEIYQALAQVKGRPGERPRAIALCRDPWLDMLLVPTRGRSAVTKGDPAAIAFVHGDNWHAADRHEQLAELFNLSPHEARMALALSRGMTLAEAATEFGLTVGTARTYSKNIYAKTGARGLPDLVRIVMRSVLAIAPEV
jgi:DNA-binding CsgD family transcriptional regulator